MEKIMDVWSDNWNAEEVINIIHDYGYTTAGMERETIGVYAENVEWTRCKDGELPAMCVCLTYDDDTFIHGVDEVEEKPLFLYKLTLIVPDTPKDTAKDSKGENNMDNTNELSEKKVNVTLNLGLITKNFMPINKKTAMKIIALSTDCTVTECTGVYHGHIEPSYKIEIYDTTLPAAVALAREFARTFNQECVAVSYKWKTIFVEDMSTADECAELIKELAKGE